MNVPTLISFGRLIIALISFIFIFLDFWIIGSILILVAVLLDILDGKIARMLKQVTKIGVFLDIMVDKVVIISTFFIVGIKINVAFFYLGLLMLLREYSIDTMRSIAASQGKVISADKFSKIKGVLFMIAMVGMIWNYTFLGGNLMFKGVMVTIASLGMVFAYSSLLRFFIKYKQLITE